MRALLINLVSIPLTGAFGWGLCRAMSVDPHLHEMLLAGIACLVAAELAVIPLILARRSNQLDISQAGLVATVVHMFVAASIGAAITMLMHPPKPFLWWLLTFYWVTLLGLCAAIITAIRAAPPAVSK